MACLAARRSALDLLDPHIGQTAEQVFKQLNWWTQETIEEALDEAASVGAVRRRETPILKPARYYVLGSSHR